MNMKFLNIFEKRRKNTSNNISDEIGYICSECGRENPINFKYCPHCGTKNSAKTIIHKKSMSTPEDKISVYLKKIGLLNCAEQQYLIKVQIENRIVSIPLLGKQNRSDALRYLKDRSLIDSDDKYHFCDWPNAKPCIGPYYHHVGACVCELNMNLVYHVERNEQEIAFLYGCPNSKIINNCSVLDNIKIEVVDYEK